MIPLVPHTFRDGDQLDPEAINANLLALARDVNRNLARRYTYSQHVFDLDGIVNTVPEVQRKYSIRAPTSRNVTVVGVELVIYSATGATWTLTGPTGWPSISVATAGATTEARVSSGNPTAVGASADVDFVLSASTASTITRGYLVVHLRSDRGNQGSGHADYSPTLLDASSSMAGSVLDDELTAAEAAAARDSANDLDLRAQCYRRVNATAATSADLLVWRIPASGKRAVHLQARIVAALGVTATWALKDETGATIVSVAVASVDASTLVLASGAVSDTQPDDPATSASDYTLTLSVSGGTAVITYATLWLS